MSAPTTSLFAEPVLVVRQKFKLVEATNAYDIFDKAGTQIARVTEVGHSKKKQAVRALSNVNQFATHRVDIADMDGRVLLSLTRPSRVLKSTVVVSSASGNEIGRFVQEKVVGKMHFSLESAGQAVGRMQGESPRAKTFRIEDAAGNDVGRVTKTAKGFFKSMFATGDEYVVQRHAQVPETLLSLITVSALAVDLALHQRTH